MDFKITHDFEWTTESTKPYLTAHAIHVWRIKLPIREEIKSILEKNLSFDEQYRASKFYFKADNERFIVARGALRDIITRYLNLPAQDITFEYTKFGKPYLLHSHLRFNLSHSGQYILYAFTLDTEIGIDIEECKNNIDFISVAKEFLSEAEYNQFLTLAPQERRLAFYRAWTHKEAILKAMGKGFYFPANQLELEQAFSSKSWQLFDIASDQNYVSTIAVKKLIEC